MKSAVIKNQFSRFAYRLGVHSFKARWYAVALMLFAIVGCKGPQQSVGTAPKKYNVLFVTADDLNNDLSIYGHPVVQTPAFDRLKQRGLVFNRAYCQYPLCSPSRTSFLTGLRPDSTKVFDLEKHFRTTVPGVVTLPQLFKNNGYQTARVGKIFHMGYAAAKAGTDWLDDTVSWSQRFNPAGRDFKEYHLVKNLVTTMSFGYQAADGTDEEQTDGMIAAEGIRLLKELKDKPFFLALGFFRPHTPHTAPKKYFDLYRNAPVIIPAGLQADLQDIPKPAIWKPSTWEMKETELEELVRGYWASITFMDAQLGKVLDALEASDLADNTIVVVSGDHGFSMGQHGQWAKMNLFESGVKSPLLIAAPGLLKNASTNRIVELLDLYPTLADLCGLPAPSHLQGTSLRPLLANANVDWSRPAYTQISFEARSGRSVRDDRYRYTEWAGGSKGIELYDYAADPAEITNLANKPGYAEIQKRMAALLSRK